MRVHGGLEVLRRVARLGTAWCGAAGVLQHRRIGVRVLQWGVLRRGSSLHAKCWSGSALIWLILRIDKVYGF